MMTISVPGELLEDDLALAQSWPPGHQLRMSSGKFQQQVADAPEDAFPRYEDLPESSYLTDEKNRIRSLMETRYTCR